MTDVTPCLTALGQALATLSLYRAGHPARERAVESAYQSLRDLQQHDPTPQFSFLEGEVLYQRRILQGLAGWDWAGRFDDAGIQRIEVLQPEVSLEEFQRFLADVHDRLTGTDAGTAAARQLRATAIRFGTVAVHGAATAEALEQAISTTFAFSLQDEIDGIGWVHQQAAETGRLAILETDAIVRALAVAMHGQSQLLLPLLELKEFDQYTTTHASNVSVLSMALAEQLGFAPREVRALGVAGMLHDLGKIRIPKEVLLKPGAFTPEETAVMRRHPTEGARIIVEREQHMDLAAVVAYEHHLRLDGDGYPTLHYSRQAHYASRLVHVCDVYDALCTNRPYREAWAPSKALDYLLTHAGTDFDTDLVNAFSAMIRHAASRRVSISDPVLHPN